MLNKLILFFILISFTVSLEAASKEGKQKKIYMMKNSVMLENLTPEQKKQLMEIRAEALEEESKINNRLKILRKDMNECMLSKNPDMAKFKLLHEESNILMKQRQYYRKQYREKMEMIMKNQS
jgi:Spy/CpxP family protein refolding chaperone